jgi:hypothetical protein
MDVEFPDDDIAAKRSRGVSIDRQSMCGSINAVALFRLSHYEQLLVRFSIHVNSLLTVVHLMRM